MATTLRIDNQEDILDIRDIIARYEEIEESKDDEEQDEAAILKQLLADLKGNGGDEDWRGAWYPLTLIRDSHFRAYAEELAEDIGAISRTLTWPLNHIDWESAAKELQSDYVAVDFDGIEYFAC